MNKKIIKLINNMGIKSIANESCFVCISLLSNSYYNNEKTKTISSKF